MLNQVNTLCHNFLKHIKYDRHTTCHTVCLKYVTISLDHTTSVKSNKGLWGVPTFISVDIPIKITSYLTRNMAYQIKYHQNRPHSTAKCCSSIIMGIEKSCIAVVFCLFLKHTVHSLNKTTVLTTQTVSDASGKHYIRLT